MSNPKSTALLIRTLDGFLAIPSEGVIVETWSALSDNPLHPGALQRGRWHWFRGSQDTQNAEAELGNMTVEALERLQARIDQVRTVKAPAREAIARAKERASKAERHASGPLVLIGRGGRIVEPVGDVDVVILEQFSQGKDDRDRYPSVPEALREQAETSEFFNRFNGLRTLPTIRTLDGTFVVLGTDGSIPEGEATYMQPDGPRFFVLVPDGTRDPSTVLGTVTKARWDNVSSATMFTVKSKDELALGRHGNVREFTRQGPQGPWNPTRAASLPGMR